MRVRTTTVVIALALAGLPTPTHAADDEPDFRDRAAEAYVEGRYADASEYYRLAFQEDHDAWLLYARAAAEHRGGHYENALALYSWYVATDPPEDKRKAAESNIAVCHLELASRTSGPPPKAEGTGGDQALADPFEASEERPLALDPAGFSLALVSVAGFVMGAGFGIGARQRAGAASRAPTQAAFEEERQGAQKLATAATVTVVLASVAAIGSMAAYHVAAKKRRERRVGLAAGGVQVRF